MTAPLRVAVFGSTGSIGQQTLEVARRHPDRLRVTALAAGRRAQHLVEQVLAFEPEVVAISGPEAAQTVREQLRGRCRVVSGPDAAEELAGDAVADTHVHAITGIAGLRPMLRALRCGKSVAFATKEPLVAAGDLVMAAARDSGSRLAPIDSEISALWQCLAGAPPERVKRLLLTASGGPFRTWPARRIADATVAEALAHPTWEMGAKITVDSASMMNKGLELIEASRFFGIATERIDVILHPQSVVHSMVEFEDGAILAQLGSPDMRLPIQYALLGPDRPPNEFERVNWAAIAALTFEQVDVARFPCVRLAYEAARVGGTATTALNAANEVANHVFREGRLPFGAIAATVEHVLHDHCAVPADSLETVESADRQARAAAEEFIQRAS
jgi:1-deoxy-D-xylulose-5-phosphate reductoisomerase